MFLFIPCQCEDMSIDELNNYAMLSARIRYAWSVRCELSLCVLTAFDHAWVCISKCSSNCMQTGMTGSICAIMPNAYEFAKM